MAPPGPTPVDLDAWVTRHSLSFFVAKRPQGEGPDLRISLHPDRIIFRSETLPLRSDGTGELSIPYSAIQRLRVPRFSLAACRKPVDDIHAACELTARLPATGNAAAPGFGTPPDGDGDEDEELQQALGLTHIQTLTFRFSVSLADARSLRSWRRALGVPGGIAIPTRLVMWGIAVLALARDVIELALRVPMWVYPALLGAAVVGGIVWAAQRGVFGPASPQVWARFLRAVRAPGVEESA